MNLYYLFMNLRDLFKRRRFRTMDIMQFDFTSEGKLNVSLIYIDWIKLGFGPSGKENYYMYKKFGVLPETEYEMEEVREVEKYVKRARVADML